MTCENFLIFLFCVLLELISLYPDIGDTAFWLECSETRANVVEVWKRLRTPDAESANYWSIQLCLQVHRGLTFKDLWRTVDEVMCQPVTSLSTLLLALECQFIFICLVVLNHQSNSYTYFETTQKTGNTLIN